LGVSDSHYFAWLRGALERFEEGSRLLDGIRHHDARPVFWVLAGATPNPATDFVAGALGAGVTLRFLDRFAEAPGVMRADLNALDELPPAACDVLMMTRASYMVEDPRAFLSGARRLLRPGGIMIADWVHGSADAPALDLMGVHEYEGRRYRFRTTYADPASLCEFPCEFDAFIRHVNRPPWRANPAEPGVRLPLRTVLRRLVNGGPSRGLTAATYIDALRADLGRKGGHLIEPGLMEEFFKVSFRDARYLHRLTGKFHLYLLTVLRPVGTYDGGDAWNRS
jgi:SAM-dependent methyltransferase